MWGRPIYQAGARDGAALKGTPPEQRTCEKTGQDAVACSIFGFIAKTLIKLFFVGGTSTELEVTFSQMYTSIYVSIYDAEENILFDACGRKSYRYRSAGTSLELHCCHLLLLKKCPAAAGEN